MFNGIRGVTLAIVEVAAKFKYDDQKPVEQGDQVKRLHMQHGRSGTRTPDFLRVKQAL